MTDTNKLEITDTKMTGRIKIGALISQDHGLGRWPATKSGEDVDPDMIFTVEWLAGWLCYADNFGSTEKYGNGAIFVPHVDDVELI